MNNRAKARIKQAKTPRALRVRRCKDCKWHKGCLADAVKAGIAGSWPNYQKVGKLGCYVRKYWKFWRLK